MNRYYYTSDFDERIFQDADIFYMEAETEEEGKAKILEEFTKDIDVADYEDEGEKLEVILEDGEFGDCWVKCDKKYFENLDHGPFEKDDLYCSTNHPGHSSDIWITPTVPVYIWRFKQQKG